MIADRLRVLWRLTAAAALVSLAATTAGAQVVYPFPPGYRYLNADASVRLEVTPKEAEVYVDGYYAGIVDDFDGTFQRLHAAPGQHEITLYLDGYHTVHQNVYLMPDKTFRIKQRMEKLAAGEANEARPVPMTTAEAPEGLPRGPLPRGRGREGQPVPPPPSPRPPSEPNPPAGSSTTATTGTLSIELAPADAEVLVDGQPLAAAQGPGPLVMDLSEGRHVVQVRKQGFVGYLTEVQIRRGATTTLTVNLRTQP